MVIIYTVVITVVSVLVLGYFIWSGVKARGMRKTIKNLGSENARLQNEIIGSSERGEDIFEILRNDLEEYQNNVIHDNDMKIREEEQKLKNVYINHEDGMEHLKKEIDKRFNTVYEKLAEKAK